MAIFTYKNAYATPEKADGKRILVTRYWLRGLKKEAVDVWYKDLAPSKELLAWAKEQYAVPLLVNGSNDEDAIWAEFTRRYKQEMQQQPELIAKLREMAKDEDVTLLCSCKNEWECHRSILKILLLTE